MVMAFLLVVTGIYTGSMAPGVSVEVRLRAENVETFKDCTDLGGKFGDAMVRFGANSVTIDCVER